MTILNYVLQYLHIVCAAFWIGSLLYSELILWPRLRALGQLQSVQSELRTLPVRRLIGVFNVGTIITGLARGYAAGALDRLYEPYGQLFMLSAILGVWMITWWISFPPRAMKTGWRMFYASFWVILALMIAMRFVS